VPECCPTCPCKNKERTKRSSIALATGVYVADADVVSKRHEITHQREKRDTLDEVVKVDAKCNSEDLRSIIIENVDRVTSVSKRRIQAEAENRLGGRYNVICARGDFSYITNTEEYCQQTIGDITCYAFKQLSDAVRARLS
ncbi:ground-like domain protein, partial [Oesophagostomum dentatum]